MKTNEYQKESVVYYNKKKSSKSKIIVIIIVSSIVLISLFVGVELLIMIFNQSKAKPIIYLYPEQTTELSVTLGKPENITCSYPQYDNDGWQVIANPDGNLIDKETGRNLYALYWEGKNKNISKFDEGFVVKSEDSLGFLEEKLALLGLNEQEAEEFIVYWLPKLQKNKYNLIKFISQEESDADKPLNFSVQPDTIIRVMMQFKGINRPINIKEQSLTTPERKGFVAVEWGGTEIE